MEQSETLGHLLAFLPDYTGFSLSYCGKAWTPLSWVETTELFLSTAPFYAWTSVPGHRLFLTFLQSDRPWIISSCSIYTSSPAISVLRLHGLVRHSGVFLPKRTVNAVPVQFVLALSITS